MPKKSIIGSISRSFSDSNSPDRVPGSGPSFASSSSAEQRHSFWSGFRVSAFSSSGATAAEHSKGSPRKGASSLIPKHYAIGWTSALRRAMNSGSVWRILGLNKTGIPSVSNTDIWLLGCCYKVAQDDSPSTDPTQSQGFASFVEDFSSRILITYRKGFAPIGESKYTNDSGWGCMLRSSQMLVAQALLFHRLGRSWRKSLEKLLEQNYLEILNLFGDSEESAYSIHNLLQAGKAYDLSPGSWVGPYAMCRTWETLACCKREDAENADLSRVVFYVVSGDEDGERGGAPALCIDDISRRCLELSKGQVDWAPIILLVPLVLGLDKVNPRYIPLLKATFSFPQSLGILGGRPGVSTYIVGVQDDQAFYLDPHEVQQVVDLGRDNLDIDTSSYHCDVVRQLPLDSIDPSLAIGFYCKDKSDFDDFCARASELVDQSGGAPLFTITETRNVSMPVQYQDMQGEASAEGFKSFDATSIGDSENGKQEDDWQLL
ncbi:PREDICTED: cysteine protease ATG4-like [Ipomoea nil]|uniref:cysteine protease ATG4-like n=1 Tax=Ipomoea nil TaxID=35883 RepID=UPI0009011C3D|nr:PREDICTED: cysteine protease ATG4-like [Ipomoea nil]